VGYSTSHREAWLVDAKHHYDVLHVAYGVHGKKLRELFARTDVAINLHGEPYPSFENRVCLHLAAGHLVLSEPLSPLHGLEPGIDFLELRSPGQLLQAIFGVRAFPDVHDVVRRRGRRKAEQFRASRVWPRVLGDLVRDVAAFGERDAFLDVFQRSLDPAIADLARRVEHDLLDRLYDPAAPRRFELHEGAALSFVDLPAGARNHFEYKAAWSLDIHGLPLQSDRSQPRSWCHDPGHSPCAGRQSTRPRRAPDISPRNPRPVAPPRPL